MKEAAFSPTFLISGPVVPGQATHQRLAQPTVNWRTTLTLQLRDQSSI
jgi:hypothetical protein